MRPWKQNICCCAVDDSWGAGRKHHKKKTNSHWKLRQQHSTRMSLLKAACCLCWFFNQHLSLQILPDFFPAWLVRFTVLHKELGPESLICTSATCSCCRARLDLGGEQLGMDWKPWELNQYHTYMVWNPPTLIINLAFIWGFVWCPFWKQNRSKNVKKPWP